jgi:hypothetical protein
MSTPNLRRLRELVTSHGFVLRNFAYSTFHNLVTQNVCSRFLDQRKTVVAAFGNIEQACESMSRTRNIFQLFSSMADACLGAGTEHQTVK